MATATGLGIILMHRPLVTPVKPIRFVPLRPPVRVPLLTIRPDRNRLSSSTKFVIPTTLGPMILSEVYGTKILTLARMSEVLVVERLLIFVAPSRPNVNEKLLLMTAPIVPAVSAPPSVPTTLSLSVLRSVSEMKFRPGVLLLLQ